MPVSGFARQVRLETKKRSRPPGASWDQEGALYGQEACCALFLFCSGVAYFLLEVQPCTQ
jgi:hypothetical protein